MDNIVSQLMKQDYIIIDRTANIVLFKDDNWQIRSKTEIFKKVDKGKFEIEALENGTLIKFNYYISFLPEFIIALVLMIFSLMQGYFILLGTLPFLIQLVVRIYGLKEVSREIVANIGEQ